MAICLLRKAKKSRKFGAFITLAFGVRYEWIGLYEMVWLESRLREGRMHILCILGALDAGFELAMLMERGRFSQGLSV